MELLVQRTNDSRVDVTFALSLYFAEELLFSVMLNYLCWPYQITLILQSAAIQDMALFISWPMVVKKKNATGRNDNGSLRTSTDKYTVQNDVCVISIIALYLIILLHWFYYATYYIYNFFF